MLLSYIGGVWKYFIGRVLNTNCKYEMKERPRAVHATPTLRKGLKMKGKLDESRSKELDVACSKEGEARNLHNFGGKNHARKFWGTDLKMLG